MFSHVCSARTTSKVQALLRRRARGAWRGCARAEHERHGQTRLFYRHDGGTFGVGEPINGEPATFANGGTIGFKCNSPEQVRQFHDTAVAHGGASIEDPPGLREGKLGAMHLAYVRDPDGNKLCALHRPK